MIRLLHLLAITCLLGSAGYAYSTKYETLYYAETLTKLRSKVAREREAIAVSKAEWALMTRPDRLQGIADKHLDLQPMAISQLARMSELPQRPSRGDEIAKKLELLGMETGSITPAREKAASPAKSASAAPRPLPAAARPAATAPRPVGIAAKIESEERAAAAAAAKPARERGPADDLRALLDRMTGASSAPAR